ncbi:MAG: 4-alpha-glucanotransferase [Solobacterium sp.]|jgi:4-alpha-glucanotransferase|nr:4-alpha-glucanotransferase [Solobacterium sp.]
MYRSAGILLPITSLPSKYGIGTMGKASRDFIDFLAESKQSYWQILPIGPTSYGDSPYSSFSSYAGNPYLIDLDDLAAQGLLKKSEYANENWGKSQEKIDYGLLYRKRFLVLRKATDRLEVKQPKDYQAFLNREKHWLADYALYMSIKQKLGGKPVKEWPKDLRNRDPEALARIRKELASDVAFWTRVQYLFYTQWKVMSGYAHDKGIRIIGDIPFYVAADSVDVWANPHEFQLDSDGRPKEVAGCPPDGFSADGQLWGNPLFDWEKMKKDGYAWWTRRIRHQLRFYDVLRIDHFRGFASYYAIPAKDKTARNGRWRKGPGIEFFRTVEHSLGKLDIIAEDLGFLTPEVIEMVKESGYPGMKVLEFAFDTRDTGSGYLPHTYPRNCVVYAGTHDNDTILGWMRTAPKGSVNRAKQYMHMDQKEGYNWGMMRGAYESVADVAIMQLQDLLGLGSKARINIPSTTGNWTWRCLPGKCTHALAKKMAGWMELYGRLPKSDVIDRTKYYNQ